MSKIQEAVRLVAECEAQIRRLIEQSLVDRRYDEIPSLAALASALASATSMSQDKGDDAEVTQPVPQPAPAFQAGREAAALAQSDNQPRAKRRRAEDYPKFQRQGNRLVKVGWSKKDRTEYEHRAPYTTVAVVVDAIGAAVAKGGYLRMEEFFPVTNGEGEELPSYQVYLVIAWLRDLGVLDREGNDGYRLVEGTGAVDIQPLWEETPERH